MPSNKDDRLIRNLQVWSLLLCGGQLIIIALLIIFVLGTLPMQKQTQELLDLTRDLNSTSSFAMGGIGELVQEVEHEQLPSAVAAFLKAVTPLIRDIDKASAKNFINAATEVARVLPDRIREIKPSDIREIMQSVRNATSEAERILRKLDGGAGVKIVL